MVAQPVEAPPDDRFLSIEGEYEKNWLQEYEVLLGQIPRREFAKRRFLAALCITGRPNYACRAAQIHKSTYKYWLHNDPLFVEAARAAQEQAAEVLIVEARRRAVEGTKRTRPIFFKGDQVGEEEWVEFDGKLLRFLIESEAGDTLEEKFRPTRRVEHGGQITHLMQLAERAELDQQRYDAALESGEQSVEVIEVYGDEVREVQPEPSADHGVRANGAGGGAEPPDPAL